MNAITKKVSHFLGSEDGPTAVEYAVMLALILVVCITVLQSVGGWIGLNFFIVDAFLWESQRGGF